MAARRKGFSAKQSQRMSRRMENSTVGSHVRRSPAQRDARRMNADSVSFSSSRGSSRAARGEVSGLVPSSTTREGAGAYRTRVQQRRYMEELQRRAKRRRIMLILAVVIVLVLAAGAVGCAVFMGQMGSQMALRDSDAAEALAAPAEGDPAYALISVELGEAAAPLDNGGPDALILACADREAGTLSLIDIPGNTRVVLSDNQPYALSDLASTGDAALISEVGKLAEVPITHYVKIDESGLAALVDALSGVTVDVAQEIDDPHAGSVYIPKGQQTLDGAAALVFLRATNLKFGEQDRMSNQLAFAASLMSALFSTSGSVDFAARLDSIGTFFQTDYASRDLLDLAAALGNISADDIFCASAPGYMDADLGVESSGKTAWICSSADLRDLVQGVGDGSAARAQAAAVDAAYVDPSSFTVEVQNGTQLAGAAASTAERLTAAGFVVSEVGNTDQPIYDETLLAYKGENGRACAQAVADALGVGRVVDSPEYYEFETDVLLIIGADFKL